MIDLREDSPERKTMKAKILGEKKKKPDDKNSLQNLRKRAMKLRLGTHGTRDELMKRIKQEKKRLKMLKKNKKLRNRRFDL